MRNPVELFPRFSEVAVLAAGIVLAAAGGGMAWASPPGAPDAVNAAAADPAQPNPGGVAPALSPPASAPRMPGPRIPLDATLIGTVVVKGGPSFALFRTANGSRVVREGGEIVEGARLLQVQTDRVVVGREGMGQEIVPFAGGAAAARGEAAPTAAPKAAPTPAPHAATPAAPEVPNADMARWLKDRTERVQSRLEQRQQRWKGVSGAGDGEAPGNEQTE